MHLPFSRSMVSVIVYPPPLPSPPRTANRLFEYDSRHYLQTRLFVLILVNLFVTDLDAWTRLSLLMGNKTSVVKSQNTYSIPPPNMNPSPIKPPELAPEYWLPVFAHETGVPYTSGRNCHLAARLSKIGEGTASAMIRVAVGELCSGSEDEIEVGTATSQI